MRRTEVFQEVRKMRFEDVSGLAEGVDLRVDANLLKSVGHEQEPDVRNHAR